MRFNFRLCLLILCMFGVICFSVTNDAAASTKRRPRVIKYTRLPGLGSFSNPKRIGTITRTTIITGCPPLTTGKGYNADYFSFTLLKSARYGSWVGMSVPLNNTFSAVRPAVLTRSGYMITGAFADGYWYYSKDIGLLRYLKISPINGSTYRLPRGTFLLRAEKTSKYLSAPETQSYTVYIDI